MSFRTDYPNNSPLYAAIASGSTTPTIVAATTGKRIRVLSYNIVLTAAGTVKFQTGAGSADLTGAMAFAANGGIVAPYNGAGHFETAEGAILRLADSVGSNVFGHLTYILV